MLFTASLTFGIDTPLLYWRGCLYIMFRYQHVTYEGVELLIIFDRKGPLK